MGAGGLAELSSTPPTPLVALTVDPETGGAKFLQRSLGFSELLKAAEKNSLVQNPPPSRPLPASAIFPTQPPSAGP